jgi:hypothetical protein
MTPSIRQVGTPSAVLGPTGRSSRLVHGLPRAPIGRRPDRPGVRTQDSRRVLDIESDDHP